MLWVPTQKNFGCRQSTCRFRFFGHSPHPEKVEVSTVVDTSTAWPCTRMTNSNFGSWQSKLNKRYHFRPIIGLPICSTIMKAPFIIFGQFGTQVSHSLSNILSSSTICVDSSNCLLRWAGWCVLLRVSKTALFLYQILGFQITFLRHDSFDRLPFVATTPEPLLLKSLLLHIFHQRT